ncbi:MAG: hypothetical protein ACQGVC_18265 [Myxococcota bacterium]
MPRVRTTSSSVTTIDPETGAVVNVTTDWQRVSEPVARKIAHLVEVEPEPEPVGEPVAPVEIKTSADVPERVAVEDAPTPEPRGRRGRRSKE